MEIQEMRLNEERADRLERRRRQEAMIELQKQRDLDAYNAQLRKERREKVRRLRGLSR